MKNSVISFFLLLVTLFSTSICVYFQYYLLGDYLSIFLLSLVLILLWTKNKQLFIINGYIIFALFSAALISIYLEYGVYLYEINLESYAIGITQKIVVQIILFFLGGMLSYKLFYKRFAIRAIDKLSLNIIFNLARLITFSLIVIMFFVGFKYGTPMEHSIHRNDYWIYIGPSWGAAVKEYLIQFSFLLAFLYQYEKKKLDLIIYLFLLIAIIYMGERATGIFNAIFFFSLPILIKNYHYLKLFTFKKVVLFSIFSFLILSILIMSYGASVSQDEALSKIETRVVLQPQMWWALDNLSSFFPQDLDIIINKYIGIGIDARYKGTYYLMDQVSDLALVDYRFETNSTFTLSGFANNIYFFGYFLGSWVNLVYGFIIGFVACILAKSCVTNNIIASFFAFKLFFKIQGIILGGNTPNFFSIGTLAFIGICILFIKFKRLN